MTRDTSKDKVAIFKVLLAKCRRICQFVQRIGWLNRLANALIINHAIGEIPARPNPLSTDQPPLEWPAPSSQASAGQLEKCARSRANPLPARREND